MMPEVGEAVISIPEGPLPYEPAWFADPVSPEEYAEASELFTRKGSQKEETVSAHRLYRSRHAIDKELKQEVSLSIYDEVTNADAVFTVIGSSVGPDALMNTMVRTVSGAIADVGDENPEKKFTVFTGGGRRGAMLVGQIARMLSWVYRRRQNPDVRAEKISTNIAAIGVGPDEYSNPEKSANHPQMPAVIPGPYLSRIIKIVTEHFNEGQANAWPPTSEILTALGELRKRGTPGITIVMGGGPHAELEFMNKARLAPTAKGEALVVLRGSGRFADLLYQAYEMMHKPDQELPTDVRNLRYELEATMKTRGRPANSPEPASPQEEARELLKKIHWVDIRGQNDDTIRGDLRKTINNLLATQIMYVGQGELPRVP